MLLVDGDPQGTADMGRCGLEASGQRPAAGHPPSQMGATMHRPGQLTPWVGFDRIVIDCPPRHDANESSALWRPT